MPHAQHSHPEAEEREGWTPEDFADERELPAAAKPDKNTLLVNMPLAAALETHLALQAAIGRLMAEKDRARFLKGCEDENRRQVNIARRLASLQVASRAFLALVE